MPYDSRELQQIVTEALRRDPEDRLEYIEQACAGDAALFAAVQARLDEHRDSQITGFGTRSQTAATNLLREPRVVGTYILRQELGRGGMGVVYLADDTRLGRRVALKALAPDIASDPVSRERLRREARAAAALTHPGIATVYALEEIADELFLVSEYVPGPLLRHQMQGGPLPLRQVVGIAAQLARGLAAAHAAGVVHRDIKPENISRTQAGMMKILDFGLARLDGLGSSRFTQTGTVVGTPAYMSPEQTTDQPIDFRTDLFSLGLVIFEMAAGRNPFEASTLSATLSLRLADFEPPSLASVVAGCPPDLDRIVATCLRKNPAHRYTTTEQLVDELTRLDMSFVTGTPLHASSARLADEPSITWWKTHILIVSAVYAAMIYPAWHIRNWLPLNGGTTFLLVLLVAASAAVTLRVHLLFTHSFDLSELEAQQRRNRPWTVGFDVIFSSLLLGAGATISGNHAEFAMLLVVVGVVTLLASLFIEPATTRSAFRRSGRISAARGQQVT